MKPLTWTCILSSTLLQVEDEDDPFFDGGLVSEHDSEDSNAESYYANSWVGGGEHAALKISLHILFPSHYITNDSQVPRRGPPSWMHRQ